MSLPRAEGCEKSVLSSIMQEPCLLDEAKELGIQATSFHGAPERALWKLLNDRTAKGKTLELVGLAQDIADSPMLRSLGGAAGLAEVYSYATTSAHFKEHIAQLKEKHALREARALATNIVANIDGQADVEIITSLLGQPVTHVHELLQGEIKQFTPKLGVDRLKQYRADEKAGVVTSSMKTGIAGLDRVYGGLLKPSFNIISAVPGTGKTTFLVDMIFGLSQRDRRGMFFCLEMTELRVMERLVIRASGIEGWKFKHSNNHTFTDVEDERLEKTYDYLATRDFIIETEPALHVDRLCAMARKEHKKGALDYIFIDYAQLMKGTRGKSDPQSIEYGYISNTLQALMKELGCSMVLLSQITADKQSGTVATKGGRVFTEDADVWLHIEKGGLNVTVAKDRNCGITEGTPLNVQLDKQRQKFVGK